MSRSIHSETAGHLSGSYFIFALPAFVNALAPTVFVLSFVIFMFKSRQALAIFPFVLYT